jgi:hypothetical protein
MPNAFGNRIRSPRDSATTIFDITPDDSNDLAQITTALNVSTPGSVRVTTIGGTIGNLTIQPGHAFPIQARRVWQTGTTATGIRGLV